MNPRGFLHGFITGFPGADADNLRHRIDEDLAVTDTAGAGVFDDGFNLPFTSVLGMPPRVCRTGRARPSSNQAPSW
jgi:hypothetical protein